MKDSILEVIVDDISQYKIRPDIDLSTFIELLKPFITKNFNSIFIRRYKE